MERGRGREECPRRVFREGSLKNPQTLARVLRIRENPLEGIAADLTTEPDPHHATSNTGVNRMTAGLIKSGHDLIDRGTGEVMAPRVDMDTYLERLGND